MFFASLIVDKSYYVTFKENKKLMYIWKNLWKPDEYKGLMDNLSKLKKNNFHTIFSIVKNYFFRIDALKFSMGCLYDL